MIKKTLICLNEDLGFLETYFQNDFFKKNPKIVCEFIYDKAAFDGKKQAIECNAYDAIVVLCELTWEGHTFAQLWGVELVQQALCLNPHVFTPVLFVSLFSQAEILQREPHKKIIAAYALGYHFIQLPIATKDDMDRFYRMERVSTLEKEDAYHFASRKAMVQAIRHDVKNTSESIEISRRRLLNLLGTVSEGYKQRAEEIKTKLGETPLTVKDIIAICNEIEPWFVDEYTHPSSSGEGGSSLKNYKVLFLEDEKNLLDNLKIEAKGKIEIIHCTQTSKALKKIKQDESNEIKVVVVDFRIWDKPEDYYGQRMLEPQGYRFIEKVVAMGHYCIFIALSELPRMFQHRISSLSSILIVPENKQLVLSTPQQRANFIQKLCYWAADTEERLKVNAFGSEKLFEFYKWLLMQKEELETIDTEAIKLIKSFENEINNNKSNIFIKDFKETKELLESKSYRSEWKIEEKELSNKQYVEKWVEKIFENYWKEKVWTNLLKADIKNILESDGRGDDIIEKYFEEFKNINKKSDFNKYKEKIRESLEGVISIGKLKNKIKELNYNEDRGTFVNKLIIRRFAIYLYYWIEKEFSEDNLIKNHKIAAVNYFLIKYKFDKNETYKKPDNRITSKCLRLTPNTDRRTINTLQDIALTFEEVIFFRNVVPDLYKKLI